MPVDYTGNTLSDARHLSISTSIQSHIESVGFTDTNDYYRVQLSGRSSLSLAVTGLSANANVQLLNSQGNLIQDSSNPGSLAETINQVLNAGTYYIRVFSVDNTDTHYQLSVVAGTSSNDLAGNTLSTALNIGLLNASGRYSDSVGGADSHDYYRLSLNYAGSIALSLNSLSGNADLQLLNGSGGVLQSSGNSGSTLDWINRTLTPGIYYVRVSAGAGSTANYSLSATVHATPILDLNGVHVSGQHSSASFTEGFGAVSIVDQKQLTLSDVDSSHLTQAIVKITNLQDGVAESLAVDTSGTNIQTSYNPATGILRLGGTDTVANYQKVLRSIVYNNTSQNPNIVPRNISFTVTDGTTFSTIATASVAITPSNGAPSISAIANQVTDEDVPTGAIAFTINDLDTPLSLLTLSANSSNPNLIGQNNIVFGGSGANRTITLTPNANQSGSATISIEVNDGAATTTQTFHLTVNPVNDAPIAFDNSYSASEDVPLNVNLAGILNNDLDVDGDPLSAILVSNPNQGNLTLNSDGTFLYTPNANFNGTDTFTYRALDGVAYSNLATVTITVNPVNDAPIATDNQYSIDEDLTLTIPVNGVLGNDSDIDGDPLSASLVSNPTHGTLTLNSNGAFVYTPNANFNGTDTFTYRAFDGVAYSNLATVTITVNPVNDAPIVVSDVYSVNEDSSLTVLAAGVLGNDSDIEGDPLSATLVTGTTNGSLSFGSNGAFVYTPNANFNGTDSFTYWAFDGVAYSNPVTVTITVNPVNDAPIATDNQYSIDEDLTLTIPVNGVLGNDSDIDGDPLSASLVNNPTHGTLTLNSNGAFVYTPNANFNGTDTFTYRAFDGVAYSNLATVTITVNPINDAPIVVSDAYSVDEDGSLTVLAAGVLVNDSDIEGDPLSATLVTGTSNGSLSFGSNGAFVYTPNANFFGTDTFTYRAFDGVAYSNPTTVTITVNPIDDLFIAVNDTYSVDEDGVLTLTGLGILTNDINLDNDPLTAMLVSNPTSGTLIWNSNGTFTYTPNANFNGTDSFTYRVFDGTANSNLATVNLTINPVNDAPVLDISGSPTFSTIRQNQFNTAGNSVRSLVMSSITDIDILTQTEIVQGIAIVGADTSNGVWQYSTNGGQSWTNFGAVSVSSALVLTTALANTIRFVPAANFIGTATISFRAWDSTNGSTNGAFGVNTSLNGGTTAFSTAIETAMITVRRGG